ncbi:MAG: sugar phosphate nucleotidyltransferase [Candidatus Woykebacteria bacterium]
MGNNFAAVILAAGKGTRLAQGASSPRPKVLYEIAGKPLIAHTLRVLNKIGPNEVVIVVGHKAKDVIEAVGVGYKFAIQKQRLGTGHAAKVGLNELSSEAEDVLIINGDDSAFYRPDTIKSLLEKHLNEQNTITFITLEPEDPTGLGRIVRKNGELIGIVEEKVASAEQKKIREINDGAYVFNLGWLERTIKKLKKSAVGEYYLTDLIDLALTEDKRVSTLKLSDPNEWKGVNTPAELVEADKQMRDRDKNASEKR